MLFEVDVIKVVGHRLSENETFLFVAIFSIASLHHIAVRKIVVGWLIKSEVFYLSFAVFIGSVFSFRDIVLVVFMALLFPLVDFKWGCFPIVFYPFHKIYLCLYFLPGLFLFHQSLLFTGNGLKFNQFIFHFFRFQLPLLHFLSSFLQLLDNISFYKDLWSGQIGLCNWGCSFSNGSVTDSTARILDCNIGRVFR